MASGLVLTYTTSGIFNFAHGAVAFATAYLYYQLNTRPRRADRPGAHHLGVHLRPLLGLLLDRILLRRLARHRCTPASSAPSVCWSRCRTSIQWLVDRGRQRRARPRASRATTRPHQRPARCRASGPHRRTYTTRSAASCSNSDQIAVFVVAALAAIVLWFVIRRTRVGPRDARGRRPRVARRTPRRERGAHVGGGLGHDDGARRARRRAHRPAVPAPGLRCSPWWCSARWPRSCSAACARSRSRSPAACCSA